MVRLAELKGTETVYDLGAGDGRILIAAKRMHPGIRAVGIEYVPSVWLLGKLRIWFSRTKVTLLRGNALAHSVEDAQCIFLYLFPTIMEELGKKFDRELKPGTKVISSVFRFPEREPVAERKATVLGAERLLRLYRW